MKIKEWYDTEYLGQQEKQPYDECPRCGSYRFREQKTKQDGEIFERVKKCKNCKYREEIDDE